MLMQTQGPDNIGGACYDAELKAQIIEPCDDDAADADNVMKKAIGGAANNLQAALDMLQKPADVGSIKPNDIQSLMSEVGIKPIGETSVFKMAMTVLSPEQKLKKIKILKKYFDKMRQAESLEKSGSALGDLSDAAKLRKGIPYNSSKSIQKELDQLQGVEKLDTDLLAILKKQYNL
jgi:hypothetical protein